MIEEKAKELLIDAANILGQRSAVYKGNFEKYGSVMQALFPEGFFVQTDKDHERFHILMLAVVKLTRYANNYKNGGHKDSLVDLINYAAMLAAIDEQEEDAAAMLEEIKKGVEK
jgi:hypothetical protein